MIADDALETRIRVVHYDRDMFEQYMVEDSDSLAQAMNSEKFTWLHIQGLRNVELILQIAEHFDVHPLALEDIVNVPQRPKQEVTENYAIAVTRAVRSGTENETLTEQVSLVLGRGFVLSFQETHDARFEPVRQRLQRPDCRLRRSGHDYLAYVLLDTIVDEYFPMLERLGDKLDTLEEQILTTPVPSHLQEITKVKRQLIRLRRTTWAQREMMADLLRNDGTLASDQVKMYTRDTFEHCIQIAEVVDMYRESATGLVNTYLSAVGQRTNEIMKTLTIVGSIFIPLTFLAGIYGMNFENMPELQSRWAYPTVWFLMVAIAGGMVYYFYRCGWLGERSFTEQISDEPLEEEPAIQSVHAGDWNQQQRGSEVRRRAA